MKKLIFIIIYISLTIIGFSQNNCYQLVNQATKQYNLHNYGRALKLLNKAQKCETSDTSLIKIYSLSGKIYENLQRYNNAIRFFIQKEHIINKILAHNSDKGIKAELFYTELKLGQLHKELNEYNIAVDYFIKALSLAYQLDDKIKTARSYMELGDCYTAMNFYDKALNNYINSYRNFKKFNLKDKELASLLKIARIYSYKSEYKKALETYYNALPLARTINTKTQSQIYLSIAQLLYNLRFYKEAEKYLTLAKNNLKDSSLNAQINILKSKILINQEDYKTAEKLLNETLKSLPPNEKLIISDIYDQLGIIKMEQGNLKQAHLYFLMAYNLRLKSQDLLRLGQSYLHLGGYFFHTNDYHLAQIYFIKAYQTFLLIKNHQLLGRAALNLAYLLKYQGNYPEAFKYMDIYRRIEDSIIHKNQVNILQKLDERDKINLQKKIAIQKLKITRKYNKYLFSLVVFLFFSILFLVYQTLKIKKKNQKLKAQKQQLEDIQEFLKKQNIYFKRLYIATYLSSNSIFITKPDGKIIWFNKTCKQLYNLSKDTIGKNLMDLSTYQNINQVYEKVNRKKIVKYTNYHIVKGKKIWIQTLMTPLVINNKVVEIIGIETNITQYIISTLKIRQQQKELLEKNLLLEKFNQQLKQQQRELRQKNEELIQQQEELQANAEILEHTVKRLQQFSTVLETIDNYIFLIDTQKNIIWWNKSLARKIGITPYNDSAQEENVSQANQWLKQVFDQSQTFSLYFEKTLKTKKSHSFIYLQKFNNQSLWLQTTITPILDNNQVQYIAVIQSDITKLKQTEKTLAEKNKELLSSLEYAKKIQLAVSPMPIFMEALFYKNYFIFMRPRDIVSGDFYWAKFHKGKVLLAVADATGHGIPAAFISLIGTMAMNSVIEKIKKLTASAFLSELKEQISIILHQRGKKNEARDSIDLAFCIFDFNKGTLEFAGAYIPLYLLRRDKDTKEVRIITLKENKNTIGFDMHKPSKFISHSVKLQYGDMIYISTDGYLDQFGGEKNKKFKRKRFLQLLKEIYHLPVYDQRNKIKEAFYSWKQDNAQVDDVLVFGLRIDENLI